MMLNKLTLVSCLLFFLFGSHTFADSHLETNTTPPAQVETTKAIETAAPDTETLMKEKATEVNKTISEKPSVMNYVLPAIMGLIIVFGFGSYWLIFRRKQV
jgi:copper resistance protein C